MTIARQELTALPVYQGYKHPGFVYALEFSDGTVKVGATTNPRIRAQSLCDFAARYGIGLLGVYVESVQQGCGKHDAERAALAQLGEPACGKEWFSGISIHDAIQAIKATKQPARKRKPATV